MKKMKKYQKCSYLLLLGLLAAGCAKTNSENIKTSGFYAGYSVWGNNTDTATCNASFQVSSGGTYISLSDGDSVTCNGVAMSRTEILGQISYSATVSYAPETIYTITLTRSGETPYSATVTLPSAIQNMTPANSSSIHKGTAFSTTWTPSSNSTDVLNVDLSGSPSASDSTSPCPSTLAAGSGTPESGTINWANNNTGNSGTCTETVHFTRYRNGTMPSGLDGKINSQQRASIIIYLID